MESRKKKRAFIFGIYATVIVILAAVMIFYSKVERTPLVAEDDTEFAKAVVLNVVSEESAQDGMDAGNQQLVLKITSGNYKGMVVEGSSMNGYLYGAYCEKDTKVIVRLSEYEGTVSASVYNYDRELPILLIVVFFLAVMWVVGGKRGIHSITALVFTFFMILTLYIPLMYIGWSPFVAAVLCVILITTLSLLLIGGAARKTICAIAGTVAGVVAAGVIAQLFGNAAHISGYNVENIETLVYIGQNTKLNIGEMLFSGILISSLGAVMDVAMSVSSALSEICEKSPDISRKELFKSGMRIGRDMIGTMSNTLILAYVGSSVNTLMIIYAYQYSAHQVMGMYSIGIEIMQSLSGTLGIILTVPFVSAVSAYLYKKQK
ncbi:MAG: YibE/F family protein [Lachnospiraceae bacterium]|nr:YibE/F family protein [Lachnospiraceae bacterium]